MERSARTGELRLLLLSERAGVHALFANVRATGVADADVAVVDAASGPRAVDDVSALLAERPALPVAALVCCPRCIDAATMRALLAAGVCGLLDLHASSADLSDSLAALADGATVLHSRLANDVLRDVFAARPQLPSLQAQVLAFVAQGLRDREIGERLHLSPHTVKHRVDQLCRTVHARNRIELAAWAGRNGF
jgi:DNA-binding NarL/FixJ family response regulator